MSYEAGDGAAFEPVAADAPRRLTIAEAKARMLEADPPREGMVSGWIRKNPAGAVLAAVGVGVIIAVSPRLRRLAFPLLTLAIRKSIF